MSVYRELLIGCGHRRERLLDPWMYVSPWHGPETTQDDRWKNVMAVDINPRCDPDYIMDLERGLQTLQTPRPDDAHLFIQAPGGSSHVLKDDVFDELHAYEVLEHLGHQGNVTEFFGDFDELWRVLKPGGWLCATVPSRYSVWLWGDPGHRRAILPAMLPFLNRPYYEQQLGRSPMSDYRELFWGDWDIVHSYDNDETHSFILKAIKPRRDPLR